jgi:two-component system response regulator RegA
MFAAGRRRFASRGECDMLCARAFVDEQPSILLVDDDEVFRERLARALRERGWEVRTAADYTSAMEAARAESPQHALVDLRMQGR